VGLMGIRNVRLKINRRHLPELSLLLKFKVVKTELIWPSGKLVTQVELVYRSKVKASERPAVIYSKDAAGIFLQYWNLDKIELLEEFKSMYLNRAGKVLAISDDFTGGISGVVADVRLIYATALQLNAVSLVICHNHPSGDLSPSDADKVLTGKIMRCARCLDYKLLDHIILTKESYFSFADNLILRQCINIEERQEN
jgi:DNA repair protein RadC